MTDVDKTIPWTYVKKRIVYYAELGVCDGGGVGYWTHTTYSKGWPTYDKAEKDLLSMSGVKKSGEYYELAKPFGLARVRVAEEEINRYEG